MPAKIAVVNLADIAQYLEEQPEVARHAAQLAVNDTARRSMTPIRSKMKEQVAFPPGYLNEDRLAIRKYATQADLTATISARHRPTSLARFARGQSEGAAKRRGGVRVRVNSGGAKFMKGAFFVNLPRGKDTQDGFNVGLAIRLKPGQTLKGRRKGSQGVQLADNLYLLYGPSVDQVFRDVSTAETPAIGEQLEREFLRQYVRLSGKA